MPVRKDHEMLSTLLSTPVQPQQVQSIAQAQVSQPTAAAPATPPLRMPVPAGPALIPPPTAVRGVYRRIGTTLALAGADVSVDQASL